LADAQYINEESKKYDGEDKTSPNIDSKSCSSYSCLFPRTFGGWRGRKSFKCTTTERCVLLLNALGIYSTLVQKEERNDIIFIAMLIQTITYTKVYLKVLQLYTTRGSCIAIL
jgi:hypothetical protein